MRQRAGKKLDQDYCAIAEGYLRVLTDEWLLVTDDNYLLPDSFVCTRDGSSSVYLGGVRKDGRMDIRLPEAQHYLETPVFVLGCANNYAHWVMDVLPRLKAWKEESSIRALPVLIDQMKPRFYRDWLEVLGVPADKILEVPYPASIICRQAVIASVRTDTRFGLPIRNAAQLSWLAKQVENPAVKKDGRLYITRNINDPAKRRVTNEQQMQEMVRRHGFEVVDTDGMGVREQITLFQRAQIIVSVHGAGLANTVFSPKGMRLIELVNEVHNKTYNDTQWFIRSAAMLGHHYTRVVGTAGEANERDSRPVNLVGTYDVAEVETAILKTLA